MPTRRAIQGVLQNFLGTFTSRYSDYNGYWLLGILADDLIGLRIDLLAASTSSILPEPMAAATTLAQTKFREQMQKAGLLPTSVREAHLSVTRSTLSVRGEGQRHRDGYNFSFIASAIADCGLSFEAHAVVFVAPHNPALELRSTRSP